MYVGFGGGDSGVFLRVNAHKWYYQVPLLYNIIIKRKEYSN